MSEDIVPTGSSRASSTEESLGGVGDTLSIYDRSVGENASLARSTAPSVASYQSIASEGTVIGTGPVRYVLSGIKPSLSYLEVRIARMFMIFCQQFMRDLFSFLNRSILYSLI